MLTAKKGRCVKVFFCGFSSVSVYLALELLYSLILCDTSWLFNMEFFYLVLLGQDLESIS